MSNKNSENLNFIALTFLVNKISYYNYR